MKNRKRNVRRHSRTSLSVGQIASLLFGLLFLCTVFVVAFKEFVPAENGVLGRRSDGTVVTVDDMVDDVTDQVMAQISDSLVTEMVKSAMSEQVTDKYIMQVLEDSSKNGGIDLTAAQKRSITRQIQKTYEALQLASTDMEFTDDQKRYISTLVKGVIDNYIQNGTLVDAGSGITLDDDSIESVIDDQILPSVEDYISLFYGSSTNESDTENTSSYQLTDTDIANIKQSLNISDSVKSVLKDSDIATSAQIAALSGTVEQAVIARVLSDSTIKSSLVGDVLSESQVTALATSAANTAATALNSQIATLTTQLTSQAATNSANSAAITELRSKLSEVSSGGNVAAREVLSLIKGATDSASEIFEADANGIEGTTILAKLGSIANLLSSDGSNGLQSTLSTLMTASGAQSADLSAILTAYGTNIDAIRALIGGVAADLSQEQQDRIDALQAERDLAHEELMAEKDARISALRSEAELRVNSIAAIQTTIQDDMDTVNSKFNDYQQALVDGNEAVIASARAELEDAVSSLNTDMANNKDILLRAIGDAGMLITESKDTVVRAYNTYKTTVVDGDNFEIASAGAVLVTASNNLKQMRNDNDASLALDVRNGVDAYVEAISNYINCVNQQGDTVSADNLVESKLSDLETALSNNSQTVMSAMESAIEALNMDLSQNIDAIASDLTTLSAAHNELQGNLDTAKTDIGNELTRQIGLVNADIANRQQAINDRIDASIASMGGINTSLSGQISAEQAAREGAVQSLESTISSVSSAALSYTDGRIQEASDAINGTISNLENTLKQWSGATLYAASSIYIDGDYVITGGAIYLWDSEGAGITSHNIDPAKLSYNSDGTCGVEGVYWRDVASFDSGTIGLYATMLKHAYILQNDINTRATNADVQAEAQELTHAIESTQSALQTEIDATLALVANSQSAIQSNIEETNHSIRGNSESGPNHDLEVIAANAVSGTTIYAKIGALKEEIGQADTWASNITLANTSGMDSAPVFYMQSSGIAEFPYMWVIDGVSLGLNFKANNISTGQVESVVNLSFAASYPVEMKYDILDGELRAYANSIPDTPLIISSIHVQTQVIN